MSAAIFLIGVVGGLSVSVALFYPLNIYLPSLLIANFQKQFPLQINFVWGCLGLTGLLFIVIGIFAARWSKLASPWGTAKAGAVAGFIAAMVAFGAMASPAAGLWGNKNIFVHGLIPAVDNTKFFSLLLDAVIETLWWNSISMWILIICGSLLGGLGGALVKVKHPGDNEWQQMSVLVSPIVLIVSAASFYISYTASDNLLQSIISAITRMKTDLGADYYPIYDPRILFILFNSTIFFWLLFWQIRLWMDLRFVQKNNNYQKLSYALAGMLALVIPILLTFAVVIKYYWVLLAPSLLLVFIGSFTFRETFWKRRNFEMPIPEYPLKNLRFYFKAAYTSLVISTVTFLSLSAFSLNLILYTIAFIAYITPDTSFSIDTVELADNINFNFTFFRYVIGLVLFIPSIYFILITWASNNYFVFTQEYGLDILKQVDAVKTRWIFRRKSDIKKSR